jgi:hypothetical protein
LFHAPFIKSSSESDDLQPVVSKRRNVFQEAPKALSKMINAAETIIKR